MKKYILFLIFSIATINANSQSTNYSLRGKTDQQTGMIILSKHIEYGSVKDTAIIQNGEFLFKGFIKEPIRVRIQNFEFWIDKANMTIEISNNKFTLHGSKSQDEQQQLDKELEGKSRKIRFVLTQKFILDNPHSYVSSKELLMLVSNDMQPLNIDKKLYNSLSSEIKKSFFGKEIKEIINKKTKNSVGSVALDFTAKEHSPYHLNRGVSDTIHLSDFKEKVVLLDFWASFCIPCRKSFPTIKELYSKYHNQGFEVIAIYTDFRAKNFENWYQAIIQTQTEKWHHINVAENFTPQTIKKTDVYANYFVWAIPRKILIDRKGIIRGNWDGYSEETENEIKEMVKLLVNE